MEREELSSDPLVVVPWITQMLFMGLNNMFSCQDFGRLLCHCSVKIGEMRKTTSRRERDVTLPPTRVDQTDYLPVGMTEALHTP